MSINVTDANALADQLRSCDAQLSQAKNRLREYQGAISAHWQSDETALINKAIDLAIADINAAISRLNPISSEIKDAARQISREEAAAEGDRSSGAKNKGNTKG